MIQIRNVPEALHKLLRARAAQAGMSLSDYLKSELQQIAQKIPPTELKYRLASLEPVRVREAPATAVRKERDRR
jgi:plasmid stability protein